MGFGVSRGTGQLSGAIGSHGRLRARTAAFTLLAGLTFVVFPFAPGFPYRLEQFDLPKNIALGVLGSVCALHLLVFRRADGEDRIGGALIAFLLWGLIGAALVSEDSVVAWHTMGIFAAAAAVFLLARVAGRVGATAAVLQGTLLIIVLICALVLLEAYGGVPFLSAPGRRPGATLGNRNLAARLACMALPLIWIRLVSADLRAARYGLVAALSGALAVIVVSRSRGAFLVAVGLSLLLPAVTRWRAPTETRRRWRAAAFTWFAGLTLGTTSAVLLPNRLGWSVADFASSASRVAEYQTGTGRGRAFQAATTWRMIRRHSMWGVGPGNWSVAYPGYARRDDPSVNLGAFYPGPVVPRNDALAIVAEWGAFGAGLGLVFLVLLLGRTTVLLLSQHEGARLNGVLVVGIVLAAAMLGLFDSVLRVAPTVVLLAIVAGLSLGRGEVQMGMAHSFASQNSRPAWALAWIVIALLSAAFARSAIQDFRALRIISSYASIKDLAQAVRVAPNNVEARALLSYALVSIDRCDLARPHIQRAAEMQPHSRFFQTLSARCALKPEVNSDVQR